ncbi:hypothetical protein LCGC14_0282420 [marine sediment metagenome]|uniref:Uncharacterized protein n=1 Tax=marine sediment metagenome TaxID=412755 RepID=A0A0F9X0Y5_9ZZZZ
MIEQTRLLRFEHDDMEISNPFMSACGRFTVNPATEYGFLAVLTGGGCMALEKELEGGRILRLTDESGTNLPDMDDTEELGNSLIGLYDAQNEEIACCFVHEVWTDHQIEIESETKPSKAPGY